MNMDVCRICGKLNCNYEFKNVYDYVQEIKKVLPIAVMQGDDLPQKICPECERRLLDLNNFYDLSLKTDAFLRQSISNPPMNSPIDNLYGNAVKEYDKKGNEFIVKHIDNSTLFACRKCKRTYLSRKAAETHPCTSDLKRQVQLSTEKSEQRTQEDIPVKSKQRVSNNHRSKLKREQGKRIKKRYEDDHTYHYSRNNSIDKIEVDSTDGSAEFNMAIHEHEYRCNFCAKTFTRNAILIAHEQDHLEEFNSDVSSEDAT